MTCDHVRSHMIDAATEITRIKHYFLIINIVELDLNDTVNNLLINMV